MVAYFVFIAFSLFCVCFVFLFLFCSVLFWFSVSVCCYLCFCCWFVALCFCIYALLFLVFIGLFSFLFICSVVFVCFGVCLLCAPLSFMFLRQAMLHEYIVVGVMAVFCMCMRHILFTQLCSCTVCDSLYVSHAWHASLIFLFSYSMCLESLLMCSMRVSLALLVAFVLLLILASIGYSMFCCMVAVVHWLGNPI